MEEAISILVASWREEDRNRILTVLTGQNELCIAGVEKDETGAIIKSARLKPDVLILDLQLPGMSAPELAPIIRRRSPATAIVMFCDKDDDKYAGMALQSGISGFLLKEADTDKLVPVIKIVFSGGYYISASITARVFKKLFTSQNTEYETNYHLFSPTERGIVMHLAQGFSDKEIAEHFNFNTGTIRNYLTAIRHKTKLKNRIQIVIFSLVYGLINFEQISLPAKSGTEQNNGHFFNDAIQ